MEIKAELAKPYTEEERIEFIVEQNHRNGYTIEEQPTKLVALGYTEEEKEAQQRQYINSLSLTKREVFLAIYKDKQITPEQIREMITTEEGKIEFDYANNFYRGNAYINQIGQLLGYTAEELDYLFEHKEFPVKEEPVEETVEE